MRSRCMQRNSGDVTKFLALGGVPETTRIFCETAKQTPHLLFHDVFGCAVSSYCKVAYRVSHPLSVESVYCHLADIAYLSGLAT